ncbi:hypothetical protein P2D89_12000 [Agrobacterium rhizogenes]|uniref:hypothetical protein n=1 Tax=Rhizobium rhizogenes TaxID=359 RepID=UPI0028615ED1|nr:hypothetical protein [Rhizobium rhizogenes]MDF1889703.1 hypothetical protein [Rhizobium rhizogenes]
MVIGIQQIGRAPFLSKCASALFRVACALEGNLSIFEGRASLLAGACMMQIAARAGDASREASMIEAFDVQCQFCRTPPARGRSGFSLT